MMTARDFGLTVAPGIGLLVLGGLAEMLVPGQFLATLWAMLLTTPAALATAWVMRWLVAKDPRAGVLGMGIGVLVRGTVAVGGACLVYFATGWLTESGVAFWFWLSFAYLSTLTAETLALIRPQAPDSGERETKG